MLLKPVQVSDDVVPHLDQISEAMHSVAKGVEMIKLGSVMAPKFMVVGHRGHGMNVAQSSDRRMTAYKENSILSFTSAAKHPLDFIEFDVQVTKDDCPVIFHDDFILSQDNGTVFEKRVTELSLEEFISYGPQRGTGKQGKTLLRKTKNGRIVNWDVKSDDCVCTLQEAFQKVPPSLGFNIEIKFDNYIVYSKDYLERVLQSILTVVFECADGRPIIFSTFQPDAAILLRKLQTVHPVFFLTKGGTKNHYVVRRNSLEEAMNLCLEGGLQGIVSEIKAVFRNPKSVAKIKEANLSLLTYGKLNNVPEAVYAQHLMGINGVIVDFVQEITEAVSDWIQTTDEVSRKTKLQFSEREFSFLLSLIPELAKL